MPVRTLVVLLGSALLAGAFTVAVAMAVGPQGGAWLGAGGLVALGAALAVALVRHRTR